MLTRCPHCQTHFRVTPEQLKVRQGQVRCGACQEVFDALDSLADEIVAAAPTAAAPASPAAEEPVVAAQPVADWQDETVAPEPEAPTEPFAAATEPPTADIEAALQPGTLPQEAAEDEDQAALPEAMAAEPIDVIPDIPPAAEAEPPPESRRSQDGAAPTAASAEALPETWESVPATLPARRVPRIVGLLALLVVAGLQLAFIFRIELAVLLPGLRPALTAISTGLGSSLPYPRKAELIGIEASDLAPAGQERLLLTATLKNRAPFGQEYPHLELTLTDTQDAALVRKVLAPADYLPPDRPAGTGFAANADLAVKLTIEAPGVPAVGYRLYLFYL
jgi:predicted Zn finger-like uncharacterized protein